MEKGIFAIYKPKGITSYDVVRVLKHRFPGEKIGHGGTLDPLAEGVLVIAVGREATKKLHTVLNGTEKEYEVTIELGKVSATDDAEGPIAIYMPYVSKEPTLSEIEIILQKFKGDIEQIPPQYSAVKVQGKTAYSRARGGETTTLAPKNVHIQSIDIVSYHYPMLSLKIVCGSGVYIRSIARDLGEALKTGGYVTALKRTRVGTFVSGKALPLPSEH